MSQSGSKKPPACNQYCPNAIERQQNQNKMGDNFSAAAESVTQIKNFNVIILHFDSFSRPTEGEDLNKFAEMIKTTLESALAAYQQKKDN